MKKLLLILFFLPFLFAGAPSRTKTYTTGQVILPADVTENEDNLFRYVQTGVDVYADSSIISADITDGTIVNADISGSAAIPYSKLTLTDSIIAGDIAVDAVGASELAATAATAGSYTATDLTVDADGRITAASNGTVSLTTEVSGTLPVANGGTGQTTANASLNALLPSQVGNSGKYLTTNATDTSWASVTGFQDANAVGLAAASASLTTSNTWVDVTGASISITLASTGNIVAFFAGTSKESDTSSFQYQIIYDSTAIHTPSAITGSTSEKGLGLGGKATSVATGTYTIKLQSRYTSGSGGKSTTSYGTLTAIAW